MTLTKEAYIKNCLNFDRTEKEVLTTAYTIIEKVHDENTHSAGAEDDYLRDLCVNALCAIHQLLDHYSNEYPNTKN